MSDPTALEYVLTGATVLSAVVIAVQAWYTRRAVQQSEETVKTSRESVAVAVDALRESKLARLEAGVPRVTVSTRSYVTTSAVRKSVTTEGGVRAADVSADEVFKLPRDGETVLLTSHTLTVRNDGPGSVTPEIRPHAFMIGEDRETFIRPGEQREYEFNIRNTVKEWVDLLGQFTSNPEGESTMPIAQVVNVIYTGPRDADVTETHAIIVRGSLLRPVPDAQGDWFVDVNGWDAWLTVEVAPAEREYWRSRSWGEQF